MRTMVITNVLLLLFLSFPAASQKACGVDRWPVKTLADRDARNVERARLIPSTVSALGQLEIPEIPYPANRRIAPHELRVYRVTAMVTQILTTEDDGDWHIVLRDPADGTTLIAEIPSPECTADPDLASRFREARSALQRMPKRATATFIGVGFWDFIHNQRGRAPNGFELHPVLAIEPR